MRFFIYLWYSLIFSRICCPAHDTHLFFILYNSFLAWQNHTPKLALLIYSFTKLIFYFRYLHCIFIYQNNLVNP